MFILVVLLLTALSAEAKPSVNKYKIKGNGVRSSAYMPTDCLGYQALGIGASESASKDGPGQPQFAEYIWYETFRINYCTGEVMFLRGEIASGKLLKGDINKGITIAVDDASVEVTRCDFYDGNYGCQVTVGTVSFSATWTPTGEVIKERSSYQYNSNGYTMKRRDNGLIREAIVEITFHLDDETFTPTFVDGHIYKTNEGTLEWSTF